MLKTRKRHREPIPGYRLLEPLGRGGFGEVWKCEAPGGLFKAIKFIEGDRKFVHDDGAPALDELKAIQHIKSLRHPFLLSIERVEWLRGELVIVMELADKCLMDVFHEYRGKGVPGIPREELLRYLREAADVLDFMSLHHGLQHLDIKPGNLFLSSNHIKVADFGLVHSLNEARAATGGRPGDDGGNVPSSSRHTPTAARKARGLTPRYAAPELFHTIISSSCDQYSLAIVYQELLTGTRPFHGKNVRQLMMQHCTATPDVKALPESDRAAVARALSKESDLRFPTCMALVQALEASGRSPHAAVSGTETIRTNASPKGEKGEGKDRESGRSTDSDAILLSERRAGISALVAELIVEAKGELPVVESDRTQAAAPSTGVLQDRFPARLSPANTRDSFEAFRRHWNAQVVRETESSRTFQLPFPGRFWERWLEGTRGLLVEIRWTPPRAGSATLPELSVRIRCSDKKKKGEHKLVSKVGPLVLDSLRSHLEACPERRTQERVAWPHPIRATFIFAGNTSSEAIEGKGKDLSLRGMGLYLPRAYPGSQVQLELRKPSRGESILLFGNCVRVQLCGDGWFETGVLF